MARSATWTTWILPQISHVGRARYKEAGALEVFQDFHDQIWHLADFLAKFQKCGCLNVRINAAFLQASYTYEGRYRAICVNLLARSFARVISRRYCTVS